MKQEKTKGKGGRGGRVLVERREGERNGESRAYVDEDEGRGRRDEEVEEEEEEDRELHRMQE